MTNQPADLRASSCPFLALYTANLGPLGLGSPCLSLSCCLRRPHSPLDGGTRPQPLLSPPLPTTLPSPTDPLAESVGAICGGEATFSLPGCYFLFTDWKKILTKHRLTYAILVSLSGSLSRCFTGPVYTIAHLALWQHTLTRRMNLDMRCILPPNCMKESMVFKTALNSNVHTKPFKQQ